MSAGTSDAALAQWRYRTTQTFLTASAVLYLPAVAAVLVGRGPAIGTAALVITLCSFLVVAVAAVVRTVSAQVRLHAVFAAGYVAMWVANLAVPQGPFAYVGLISLTIMVLVFCGARAGRIATFVSGVIFLTAPAVRGVPAVGRFLALEAPGPPFLWTQVIVPVAALLITMVVLERAQTFLLCALVEQRRARAHLERVDFERAVADGQIQIELRERRRLEREVANLEDRERRELGNELHDGVCQEIAAALLRCQALERRVLRGGTPTQAELEAISLLLSETVNETHNLARGLWPLDPEPEALEAALESLCRSVQHAAPPTCAFLKTGDGRVQDPNVAQHLYRIAQEALSNAVRHAKARRVSVELHGAADELVLVVQDDGAGLPAARRDGMGLRTMAYRARTADGELSIESAPGGGTRIACRIPRRPSPGPKRGERGRE